MARRTKEEPRIVVRVKEVNDKVRRILRKLEGMDVEVKAIGDVMTF